MRLYLLPISTRRTLLYCQKLNENTPDGKTLADKVTNKAAKIWANWEQKERGWQKTLVNYGNHALRRIPYEEWGLKSVPPLSKKRRQAELGRVDKVLVVYPETAIRTSKVLPILQKLATERESLHRSRLVWCCVGMPISAPFALVPVIPNVPFFYLVYRAWSHWRALAGGKHIQFLAKNNLLSVTPSPALDMIYPRLLEKAAAAASSTSSAPALASRISEPEPETEGQVDEELLLSQSNGRELVRALDIPELEVEIERAIWQVENAIAKEREDQKSASSSKPPASYPGKKEK